jgi:hypothetical protein
MVRYPRTTQVAGRTYITDLDLQYLQTTACAISNFPPNRQDLHPSLRLQKEADMAYLGLRANCFYLPAAPFFFSNIYSIFDYPSGPCGARSNQNSALPTAGTYLRKIATRRSPIHDLSSYAKFRRLGPVWAVSSKTTMSAATIAFKFEEKQMKGTSITK